MDNKAGYIISLNEEINAHKKGKDSSIYIDNKTRYFAFKRIFDILISFLFIVTILSWLTPVIALLIKLNSKGPVFFFQKRVGKGGKLFTCFKFRTMVVNSEADRLQASENDERITGAGRVLRASNMDELPQFLNVLMGEMSIVGPRPHMMFDYKKFSLFIYEYKFRNLVKPGITGLAQVKGFCGPATDMESIFGRYQWDTFYIRNCDFLLDLRIIRKTIGRELYYWIKPLYNFFSGKHN